MGSGEGMTKKHWAVEAFSCLSYRFQLYRVPINRLHIYPSSQLSSSFLVMGWIISLKSICWSSKTNNFRNVTLFGNKVLTEKIKLKMSSTEWALNSIGLMSLWKGEVWTYRRTHTGRTPHKGEGGDGTQRSMPTNHGSRQEESALWILHLTLPDSGSGRPISVV